MRRDYFRMFVLFLMVIQVCFTTNAHADDEEYTWIDPDAWARDHLNLNELSTTTSECCKCSENMITQNDNNSEQHLRDQQQTIAEDTASIIYFKKFITILFNRKHLKYDSTLQVYERSMVFSVHSSQLNKLEQLQDPRDLDSILAEIFDNVRTPNTYRDSYKQQQATEASSGFKAIMFELLYHMWQLTNTSEIRFLLIVMLVIIVAWICNVRFNIGWLSLIFGGIFIYGYLYTYLECNRELEVNQMLEILNRDKGSGKMAGESRIVKFLKGIFSTDDAQDLQQQTLKQSAKLSMAFCRPDHVLIKYFNDLFLKYLQTLLEQCAITLTTLNGSLGFPYNIISGVLLVCIIAYVLKLTFKYILSPSAWAHFVHRKHPHQQESNATIKSIASSNEDRLSGDNLKLVLSAISAAPQRNVAASELPLFVTNMSGVEELKENIEAPSENNSPLLSSADANKQHNNNSSEESLDKCTDLTEHLHADS